MKINRRIKKLECTLPEVNNIYLKIEFTNSNELSILWSDGKINPYNECVSFKSDLDIKKGGFF